MGDRHRLNFFPYRLSSAVTYTVTAEDSTTLDLDDTDCRFDYDGSGSFNAGTGVRMILIR
jgi:hypothetical protein